MRDDCNVRCVDMLVRLDEVGPQYRCEELGWGNWILLSHDIGCLFHGVRGDDDAIVCFRIAVGESVNEGALLSGQCWTYEDSISPSSMTHTVISTTV